MAKSYIKCGTEEEIKSTKNLERRYILEILMEQARFEEKRWECSYFKDAIWVESASINYDPETKRILIFLKEYDRT